MNATELLSHITNNLNTGKPAAHDLVMASNGEPADSYKLNFDNPEIYRVRQYPEFIRKGDDIMYSPGVPGSPPTPPWGVDYHKLNRLIYERVSQKPTTAAYRVFYSEDELKHFVIDLLQDLIDSPDSTRTFMEKIHVGAVKL